MTLDISGTDVSCFGANDGTVDLTINNGTAPFTIDWSNDAFDGQEDLTQVGPDMLDVTVTDAVGCTASTSITITEPAELTLACAEDTAVSTVGGMDGAASITITGGTTPYDIAYAGPVNGMGTAIMEGVTLLSNLAAGEYTITITDANDCTTDCTVTITEPVCTMTLDIVGTEISCFGANDGMVDLTINDGTAPFTIDWSNDVFDGQEDLTQVGPGLLTVTVTDAVGCTASTMITFIEPDELLLNCAESAAVTTMGGTDGVASIVITGGTSDYNVTYDGPSSGTLMANDEGELLISDLAAGVYNILVEDANGCQTDCTVEITEPICIMTIELDVVDISCNGENDGSINLSIFDGTGPFMIDWSDDAFDGMQFIQDLSPGAYSVTVTDAEGCMAFADTMIMEPAALTLNCAQESPATTVGGDDGAAAISFGGGTPPYTLTYNGGEFGIVNEDQAGDIIISDLMPGDYTLVLVDANDCAIECNFIIEEPECNMALSIDGTNITCFGADDGTIDVTVSNATAPFTFDWTDDTLDGIEDPTGLGAGTYTVKVTDVFGCSESITIEITEPEMIALTCNVEQNVSVEGGNDGLASIFVAGGTPPFTGSYTGPLAGTIDPLAVGTNVFLQDLIAGIYTLDVTDANGCQTNCTFEITEPVCLLTVDLNSTNLSCNGGNDGAINLVINNVTPPYTVDWNEDLYDGLENLSGLAAGFYQVRITDAFGCEAEASITLTEPDPIVVKTASVNPSCFGDNNGELILETITGGTAPYEVSIDGDFFQFVVDLPISFPNLPSGTYIMTIQDANDCLFEVEVEVEAKEELTLDLGTDIVLDLGDSVRLEGIPNFVVDSLVWSPSAGLSQPDQLTTFVQPLENISYILTVFDEFGCSTSDQVNLVVQRPSDVFVPTAFSPNADGSNDRFTIFAGNSVEQILNFQIFDRWGNQLYQNGPIVPNDPTLGWDGNYNGQMMNTGVYVYFIEIQMVDGSTELLKGDVLLLRN
jgi:gliding motility-associated-like protein